MTNYQEIGCPFHREAQVRLPLHTLPSQQNAEQWKSKFIAASFYRLYLSELSPLSLIF